MDKEKGYFSPEDALPKRAETGMAEYPWMERVWALITQVIPAYAVVPLLSMLGVNMVVYYMSRLVTDQLYHYNLSSASDQVIPFVPLFIIPYILAFAQWGLGYIAIARVSKEHCKRYCSAEILAKLMCGVIFLVLPTTMIRASFTNDSILTGLVSYIYRTDAATNLFPSIHCMESWICMRGALSTDRFSKKYKTATVIMTILVCMSTVFVKQHVFVDIAGGILVAEAGLFLARCIEKSSSGIAQRIL